MSDSAERARARRGKIQVRLFQSMAEHDAADPAWWAGLTPEERVELTWQLSEDLYRLRGEFVDDPGLRRSVVRIIRR